MIARNLLLLIYFFSATCAGAQELPRAFNGKDFAGWKVPAGNLWWTIDEGVLQARSDSARKGSILFTEQEYGDFILKLDFKMGEGTVDSGVFVRGEHDQIQIGESGSLMRDMTASPYIPGKGYPQEAEGVAELLKPHEWNTMTIVAMGDTYTVWLNGKLVISYQSDTAIERGAIGLQLHPDRDMAIDFRNIRLAELD